MAQHITRKELKKDEIRDTLAHGAEAMMSHGRLAGILITVAVVVGLAIVGWRFYSERQTVKASAALDDAMKIFEARIRTPGEPAEPGEVTYVDEKNKYDDAARKFAEVAKNFPRTRPGQQARYFAGLSLLRNNRLDDAQKEFQQVAAGGDDELGALARFQLAGIAAKQGKTNEAVQIYRQLIEKPRVLVPKAVTMLALAALYAKANAQEAAKVLNDVKKEFPDSAAADEADKRLELLAPKS